MPPRPVRRSRSRQTTPQSPPKSDATRPSARQTRAADTRSTSRDLTGSPPQQRKPEKHLPVVVEENDVEHDTEEAFSDDASALEQPETDDSIDDLSSNGTTQLESLDADLIVDSLSALYHDATQMLSLFDADDVLQVIRDVNTPPTKPARRFRNFASRFNATRDPYGLGAYIDVSLILRKLTSATEINAGPWRPDAILQLANLSVLAAQLSQNDTDSLRDTLDRMFNNYPEPFFTRGPVQQAPRWETPIADQTLSFGLALRTQFFMDKVEETGGGSSFDPDDVLEKIFFDEHGNLSAFQPEDGEPSSKVEQVIYQHLNEIRAYFGHDPQGSVDLDQLREKYSWQEFLSLAYEWISLRGKELRSQIRVQGGVDAIKDKLENQDFTPYEPATISKKGRKSVEPQQTADIPSQKTPQTQPKSRQSDLSVMSGRIARLKAIDAEKKQAGSSGEKNKREDRQPRVEPRSMSKSPRKTPRSAVTEIAQSPDVAAAENEASNLLGHDDEEEGADEEQVQEERDGGQVDNNVVQSIKQWPVRPSSPPRPTQSSIVPTQQTRTILDVARQQAALGNKENIDTTRNAYNAKQPGAKRLQWDDSQTGRKRPRQESNETNEDSEDFETDTRPSKRTRLPRQRSAQDIDDILDQDDRAEGENSAQLQNNESRVDPSRPPPSTQPVPRRSPLGAQSRNNSSRPPLSSAPPLRRITALSSQSRSRSPNEDRDLPPAAEHEEVNHRAKATMRLRPLIDMTTRTREPQIRRAWDPDEVDRLCELIAQFGCAWALILAEDEHHPDGARLHRRTQVQLKDKARNLKMDYLKAGHRLPEGFVGVSIKTVDKQLLNSLRLPYE